ncbi:uncharacterized protein LOC131676079 [Topomyia yanbarensis]|uniref:uncharacterized protein LOC131676079 n=1 Tax=Topomyia yanbarensis TaxID=2498891 RepID=UPI00273BE52A|nr:uncharacterized protein LOC131676079 [Topomyia yanbarensis]
MIPIYITLAEDVECCYQRNTRNARRLVRVDLLAKLQHEWNNAEKGRWTHQLVPCVSAWVHRKHGEVIFYLTQFLSGPRFFWKYLYQFGHVSSSLRPESVDVYEIPDYVIFECSR